MEASGTVDEHSVDMKSNQHFQGCCPYPPALCNATLGPPREKYFAARKIKETALYREPPALVDLQFSAMYSHPLLANTLHLAESSEIVLMTP